jgi:Domain of unknown function (DUF3303)
VQFFVRWRIDNSMLAKPATPEEIGKLYAAMLKMVKEDLRYGSFSAFGQFGNGRDGYVISDLKDVTDLAAVMFKYRPYVMWKIRPVLDVDESIVVIQEASATVTLD